MVALISWLLFTRKKRLGGVFITTLPFKNILWSNHISSTTLPYGIHVINNLQSVKPDSLIWEDCVLLCLRQCIDTIALPGIRNRHINTITSHPLGARRPSDYCFNQAVRPRSVWLKEMLGQLSDLLVKKLG